MDVTVVTSGHDVADARLHRLVAAFHRAGLTVEVLGLGEAANGPTGATVTAVPRPGMAGRAVLALRYAVRARGRVVITLDPDALVFAWPVLWARRRVRVADVHEDYRALIADRSWARGVVRRVALAVATLAVVGSARAEVTLVADDHVPPASARCRLVVRNEADPSLLPVPRRHRPARPRGPWRAVYVGDIRASRGLFAMIEAIRRSPGWTLDLVGAVSAADGARLTSLLADPTLGDRVTVHGRRPPRQAWEIAGDADLGFALLDDTPAFRTAMPSKIHEYLACGIPVVTTDLPRPAEAIRSTGAGVVVPTGTPDEVGDAAASWLGAAAADPGLLDSWRIAAHAAGRRAAEAPSGYDEAAAVVRDLVTAERGRVGR